MFSHEAFRSQTPAEGLGWGCKDDCPSWGQAESEKRCVAQNPLQREYQLVAQISARWSTGEAAIRAWPDLKTAIQNCGFRLSTVAWWLEQDSSSAVQVMVEPFHLPCTRGLSEREVTRRMRASLKKSLRRYETEQPPTLLSLTVQNAFLAIYSA